MNKRALSPLIATVLLIAFAVAIGAVLMAYSGTLGECGGTETNIPLNSGSPDICYDETKQTLKFSLENLGKEDLELLKLTFYGSKDILNVDVEEPLGISETKRFTIPYNQPALGALEKLKIIPVIKDGDDEVICPADKSLIIEGIPSCS